MYPTHTSNTEPILSPILATCSAHLIRLDLSKYHLGGGGGGTAQNTNLLIKQSPPLRSYRFPLRPKNIFSFLFGATAPPLTPQWAKASSFTRFLDHTQRHTTVGRTPLDE